MTDRRDDCRPSTVWSVLKKESATRDSRTELLESSAGSSTTGSSAEHVDDVDSASLSTSSSSDVTVAAGRDRGARPKHSAGPAGPRAAAAAAVVSRGPHDPLNGDEPRRPTFSKYDRATARDNGGFVDDELIVAKQSERNQRVPPPPPQQQQQQHLGSSKDAADARTQCISVDLHSSPRGVQLQRLMDTGHESMI